MHSLNKLGERIGVLQEAISGVDYAAKKVEEAKTDLQSLFNTLVCGIPRLAEEQRKLEEELQKNQFRMRKIQYLLDSVKCETPQAGCKCFTRGVGKKERKGKGEYKELRFGLILVDGWKKAIPLKEGEPHRGNRLRGMNRSIEVYLLPLLRGRRE